MNRMSYRLVCVAVVLALTVATLPATAAQSPRGSQTTVRSTYNFLSTAFAWLNDFLTGPVARPQAPSHLSAASTTTSSSSGGGYTVNTGSCIDPLGGRCTL